MLWLDVVVILATVILVSLGLWFGIVKNNESKLVCKTVGSVHELTLKNDAFSPNRLTVTRCDTIRVVNMGTETYHLAFGVHDSHVNYPGFSMQMLRPSEFFVLDAVQAGTYTMHDHLRDKARVTLIIETE